MDCDMDYGVETIKRQTRAAYGCLVTVKSVSALYALVTQCSCALMAAFPADDDRSRNSW